MFIVADYQCRRDMEKLKAYCETCGVQPIYPLKLRKDRLNIDAWCDIVCTKCNLSIATLSCEEEVDVLLSKPKE